MFAMRMAKQNRYRWICTVYFEAGRCLDAVRIMRRRVRNRCVLGRNPQGQKGGTVVPPCDFQKESTEKPVNRGVPP